jgi:hypothetical protein
MLLWNKPNINGRQIMFTRSLCGACMALLFAATVFAQEGPDGHWEANLPMGNGDLGVSLDLSKNAKSEWIASMGIPSEGMTGLVVTDIEISDKSIKFTAVELRMAKVELTMGTEGIMKGTITSPQGPVPIEFKRTAEANVELIPASPAVSAEFEGDWEGSLETPNRPFRIIIHLKNQSDNTVAATIDTPDSNAIGLPLNDVKQTGREIEFGIKIAHGSFKGTLNQEGTEIAGQFGHEESRMPLTFRKR